MEDEQVIPAPEPEPQNNEVKGMNKLLLPLFIILILVVGAAAFFIGSQKSKPSASPSPSASPTPNPIQTPLVPSSPSGSPTGSPKATKSPTPTPTPALQTKTLNSTASLDGWRSSNNGGNSTWYVETGRNATLTSRGYVSFDLTSIPAGAKVEQASLRMYQGTVVGTPYAGNSIVADHVDYGSSLGSEDYALTPLATAIGTLTSNAVIEWKDLVVTNLVKDDISNNRSRSQYRIRFVTEVTGTDAWARFESGDNYMGTGNLPQLIVKYR